MKRISIVLALSTLVLGCVSVSTSPSPAKPESEPDTLQTDGLNSVVWLQTAAEANALRRQTFVVAGEALARALEDPSWTAAAEQSGDYSALPPAIIVDVDETFLDNSPIEARLIRSGQTYNPKVWRAWVEERSAEPLPGALELARVASSSNVTIFYVTNRTTDEEPATRENLKRVGFPIDESMDVVLTKGEHGTTSDKSGRRSAVASTHRVLLMLGDDLGDFTSRDGSVGERRQRVEQNAENWGTKWFVLPNPVYGSWERSLGEESSGESAHERKLEALDEGRN